MSKTGQMIYADRDRSPIRVAGQDRVRFLQGLISNDIVHLEEGCFVFGGLLNAKARLLTDLTVSKASEWIWLDLPSSRKDPILALLDQYIFADDVQLKDETDFQVLHLWLPRNEQSEDALRKLRPCFIWRNESWNLDAYRFFIQKEECSGFLKEISSLLPSARIFTDQEFDTWRIEAGIPRYGVDVSEDNLIIEVPFFKEHAVSYTKGCFVGQEPIARVHSRGGNISRKMTGIKIDDSQNPENGNALIGAEIFTQSGEKVGSVSSSTFSSRIGSFLGLAVLKRSAYAPGVEVVVEKEGRRFSGVTVELPIS